MGYSAYSYLIHGWALTEEQEVLFQDENGDLDIVLKKGEVGLIQSGDGRDEMHSPVLGIILGTGSEWEPTSIESSAPTLEELARLLKMANRYELALGTPKLYLVTHVL
jgi:hypothetical protein